MNFNYVRVWFLIFLTASLSACSYIYGEKGLIKDKTYRYLDVKQNQDLKLPPSVKHENKIDYAQIPIISKEAQNYQLGKLLINNPPVQVLDVKEHIRTDKEALFPTVFIKDESDFVWNTMQSFFEQKKITPSLIEYQQRMIDSGWISYKQGAVWRGVKGSKKKDKFRARYKLAITNSPREGELRFQVEPISIQAFDDENDAWKETTKVSQDSIDLMNMFIAFYDQEYIQRNIENSKNSADFDVKLGKNTKGNAALISEAKASIVWQKLPKVLEAASFEVKDQDRRQFTYFFSYEKYKPNLFASLFGAKADEIPLENGDYQASLSSVGELTAITFNDAQGIALTDDIMVKLYPILSQHFGVRR